MKVSKQQAAENRDAILQVASTQIRERGLAQVSAAEVAKAAGLTHGALYSHYPSKEALLIAAVAHAAERSATGFADLSAEQLITRYLSPEHRDNAGCGCPSAALVSEVPSHSEAVQAAYAETVTGLAHLIGRSLGVDGDPAEQEEVLFILAAMVGGVAIARAIYPHDRATSDAMLAAVATQLRRTVSTRQTNVPEPDGKAAPPKRRSKPRARD